MSSDSVHGEEGKTEQDPALEFRDFKDILEA
jgi:hypothetical protein